MPTTSISETLKVEVRLAVLSVLFEVVIVN